MARVIWTTSAETDLEDIVVYISQESNRVDTARNVYSEILQKCRLYAEQPLLGELMPDLGPAFRCFVHKRWLIVYRPIDPGIEILAVVDSSRDFPGFFQGRFTDF